MIVTLLRKPLEGTVANNTLKHGCGALNIDATRVSFDDNESINFEARQRQQTASYKESGWSGHVAQVGSDIQMYKEKGRWPANFILTHLEGCTSQNEDWACVEGCPVRELDQQSGVSKSTGGRIGNKGGAYSHLGETGFKDNAVKGDPGFGDEGGASRFFKQFKKENG